MTVLKRGGAGFIGSHLADALVTRRYSVRILDNLCEQVHGAEEDMPDYLNPKTEFIKGDIRDCLTHNKKTAATARDMPSRFYRYQSGASSARS